MIYRKSRIFVKKLFFTIVFIWLLIPYISLAASSFDKAGFRAGFGTDPQVDVLIVTVEHVEYQNATNTGGPAVVVIHESLRGGIETGKREVQWAGGPLRPKIGEKYIVDVFSPGDPLVLDGADAYPYSQESYNYILQVINDNPGPKDWAFGSILLIGLFSFIVLFLPRSLMMKGRWAGRLLKLNLLTPIAGIILFLIWNQSVSADYNIRIDLLIIPVVLIVTILSALRSIIVLFKLKKQNQTETVKESGGKYRLNFLIGIIASTIIIFQTPSYISILPGVWPSLIPLTVLWSGWTLLKYKEPKYRVLFSLGFSIVVIIAVEILIRITPETYLYGPNY